MNTYRERNKKILLFLFVFLSFYIVYQAFDFPTFLFFENDRYKDFATINYAMKDMNPYISWLSNYPPLILLISVIFTRMNDWHEYNPWDLQYAFERPEYMRSLVILFIVYAALLLLGCLLYAFFENRRNKDIKLVHKISNYFVVIFIATVFFFSAPSRFMMDRGNYLVITVVFMLFWAVFEEMLPNSSIGSIFAALSAATKVYPVYLLGSYLTEKKWKKLFVAIATGIVVTVIPIFFFEGPFFENVICFIKGVLNFGGVGGSGVYSVYFTVGVTGLSGVIFTILGIVPRGNITKLLWLFTGGTFTILGFGFLSKEEKIWKKVLIVTSLMIFLSPNSYIYNSCYLFAPLILMLMDNDKFKKADIPYYVMTALLLVPKSYFYFPDWEIGIPLEYSHVNIGVLIDCLLYLAIILYYLIPKIIKYIKDVKSIKEEDKIKLELSPKALKICKIITIGAASLLVCYFLYFVSKTVLASHDSLYDFIDARLNPFTKGFTACFRYGLARGRVGVIFPIVVAFRYLINGTGNYVLIWLLQYMPICANVALIGYILWKKIDKIYSFAFGICFFGLIQIDIWHSLVTSYPLDFMYGLFVTILGLYLYSLYLENRGSKSKLNIIRLIVSAILFYEAMQVYESFIVSSLLYVVLTLYYAFKKETSLKTRVIYFCRFILPFFVVGIIYVGVLFYFRRHPVVEVPIPVLSESFNLKRFLITHFVLSFGMFPLFHLRMFLGTVHVISKKALIIAFIGAIGFIGAFTFGGNYYSSLNADSRKRINRVLGILAVCGVIFALTFAIPHSLLPVYENWVVDNATGGYVPTTICYFGWSTAIFSIVMLFSHFFSRVEKNKRLFATLVLAFVFACSVYATCIINFQFKRIVSSTGAWMSLKAQGAWDLITDEEIKAEHPDLIYLLNISNVHGDINTNDGLFDHELGYDVKLVNDFSGFSSEYANSENPYVMGYDDDAGVAYMINVNDCAEAFDDCYTSDTIYIVSADGGTFEVTCYVQFGDGIRTIKREVTLDSNSVTPVDFDSGMRIASLNFTRE